MAEPRVALVTGGGRGIGFAIVRRLLERGDRVAVLEISERLVEGLRGSLAADADRCELIRGSVVERADVAGALDTIQARWGRLDILVNNAGINRPGGVLAQARSDWDAVLEVNLTGPFLMTAAVAPVMQAAGWGAIVNIGSIGAAGLAGAAAYVASKAGLLGLTRLAARELGPGNVTVNYVAPGVTATEWVEKNLGAESIAASAASAPLRRAGRPADVAAAVAYLTSDDARHVTGQIISVSGGTWMP